MHNTPYLFAFLKTASQKEDTNSLKEKIHIQALQTVVFGQNIPNTVLKKGPLNQYHLVEI